MRVVVTGTNRLMVCLGGRTRRIGAMESGEVWAYRARSNEELTPVQLLKNGTKKPPRVLIRFEDPAMERREEWVPPTRLRVLWESVEQFRAEEARWKALTDLSPPYWESVEFSAAEQICESLVDQEIAWFGYKESHLTVRDVPALAEAAGVDEAFVASHPAGFTDSDGRLMVPWPVALDLVKAVLLRNPEPVLTVVANEEAKARYEAIHGRYSRTSRGREASYSPAEWCAEYDAESRRGAPKRALIREWAGEATRRWDELVELRKEVKRVGDVAEAAIAALRHRGHHQDADRLSTELGMTVGMLRHDPE